MMQTTDTVLMVSPDDFKFNEQTGVTNSFQENIERENVLSDALADFHRIQHRLVDSDVDVISIRSRIDANTPDAVFPNNWFSIHVDHKKTLLVLYPMLNENRQAERQTDYLISVLNERNIQIDEVFDLTHFEAQGKALEGTGSLVLDRVNKIAYASISPRMNEEVLSVFCERMGYTSVVFSSYNTGEKLIYHTNVMMSVGSKFAVICSESITNKEERDKVLHSLKHTHKQVFDITLEQMNKMCGNILEIKSKTGKPLLAMSTTACEAFTTTQYEQLEHHGQIVHADISTIETVGGGSVRCMLAEIFHN